MPQKLVSIAILLTIGNLAVEYKTGEVDPITDTKIAKIDYTEIPDGIHFGVTYGDGNVSQVSHHGSYTLVKSYTIM